MSPGEYEIQIIITGTTTAATTVFLGVGSNSSAKMENGCVLRYSVYLLYRLSISMHTQDTFIETQHALYTHTSYVQLKIIHINSAKSFTYNILSTVYTNITTFILRNFLLRFCKHVYRETLLQLVHTNYHLNFTEHAV